jgi:branched-chain amino acid transport system permease protein
VLPHCSALLSVFSEDRDWPGPAADDHQAAQSIRIPLNHIWVIVWCVAGVVALVADDLGQQTGVQFFLGHGGAPTAVLILGGLTSVPSAIIGGLIISVGVCVRGLPRPFVGGGVEIWFCVCAGAGFLLFKATGLVRKKSSIVF